MTTQLGMGSPGFEPRSVLLFIPKLLALNNQRFLTEPDVMGSKCPVTRPGLGSRPGRNPPFLFEGLGALYQSALIPSYPQPSCEASRDPKGHGMVGSIFSG